MSRRICKPKIDSDLQQIEEWSIIICWHVLSLQLMYPVPLLSILSLIYYMQKQVWFNYSLGTVVCCKTNRSNSPGTVVCCKNYREYGSSVRFFFAAQLRQRLGWYSIVSLYLFCSTHSDPFRELMQNIVSWSISEG